MVVSTEKAARREESIEEERRKNRACEANNDSVYEGATHNRCLIHAYLLSQERAGRAEKRGKLEERRGPGEEMKERECV